MRHCVLQLNVAQFGTHLPMHTTASHRRSNRLVARVTQDDKTLLERAAELEGCSVAMFVVSRIRAAAEDVVRRHDTVKLNQAESLRFVQALLGKPKAPTKRLKAALGLHRDTVTEC
jgi:uncharacterized protein (DUF1778 family)